MTLQIDIDGALLGRLLEAAPDAIVIARAGGEIAFANARVEALFGHTRDELLGRPASLLVAPTGRAAFAAIRDRVERADAGAAVPVALEGLARDGRVFPIELVLSSVEDAGGPLLCFAIRDVSERVRSEAARSWLAAIVESSSDAVVGLAPSGTIESWNAGAERLYGYRAEETIGRASAMLVPPERAAERERGLARILAGNAEFVREETEDVRADGTRVQVALTRSPIRDASGRIVGVARIAHDITERKRLEHELRWGSEHDPLTGLFNRRRFAEELAREVTRAARYPDAAGALLLADLDGFKYINDSFGHRAGDEVIEAVARTLAERVRTTDVIARVGGDEFAVLLPHTKLYGAWLVAGTLCEAVHELVTVADGHRVRTALSVGVAPLGGAITSEDSMAIADMAMYEAKRHGGDRAVSFSRQPQHMRDQLSWADRLREALAADQFTLFAQPIVNLATGACDRQELLLRLREPDGSVVPPKAFLGAAERFGLINEIDRWVLRSAIRLLALRDSGPVTYAVNVSRLSLGDPALLALIAGELEASGVDPARLVVEISERAATADVDLTREFLAGLRRIGCGSALDDFGASVGSFAFLRELAVDFVKIDGEIVRALPGAESDRLVVRAIVDVARALGRRTIAEHAGSAAAITALREAGVDLAQGFHIGRPRPVDASPASASTARPAS